MEISLEKATLRDSKKIHKMQITAFTPLLDKYQDFDISPASETLEYFQSRFDNVEFDHYFIQLKNENIGYVRIRTMEDNVCKLSTIFILPNYQGKGYSQQAIEQVEKLYPQADKWILITIKQEQSLRYLYEKMGYVPTGEENVKKGMDLIFYEKAKNRRTGIHKLPELNYSKIKQLVQSNNEISVFSVIDRIMPGEIYVNSTDNSTSALIKSPECNLVI